MSLRGLKVRETLESEVSSAASQVVKSDRKATARDAILVRLSIRFTCLEAVE